MPNVASGNATLQSSIADLHAHAGRANYAFALALIGGIVAAALVLLALLGPERRDVRLSG